jgi:archaellum component FlaC
MSQIQSQHPQIGPAPPTPDQVQRPQFQQGRELLHTYKNALQIKALLQRQEETEAKVQRHLVIIQENQRQIGEHLRQQERLKDEILGQQSLIQTMQRHIEDLQSGQLKIKGDIENMDLLAGPYQQQYVQMLQSAIDTITVQCEHLASTLERHLEEHYGDNRKKYVHSDPASEQPTLHRSRSRDIHARGMVFNVVSEHGSRLHQVKSPILAGQCEMGETYFSDQRQ